MSKIQNLKLWLDLILPKEHRRLKTGVHDYKDNKGYKSRLYNVNGRLVNHEGFVL